MLPLSSCINFSIGTKKESIWSRVGVTVHVKLPLDNTAIRRETFARNNMRLQSFHSSRRIVESAVRLAPPHKFCLTTSGVSGQNNRLRRRRLCSGRYTVLHDFLKWNSLGNQGSRDRARNINMPSNISRLRRALLPVWSYRFAIIRTILKRTILNYANNEGSNRKYSLIIPTIS